MHCAEVRECLSRGELPNDADPHLGECERCAALVAEAIGAREAAAPPLAELLTELQAQIANERGPIAWLRSRPTGLRGLIALAAASGVVLGAALLTAHTQASTSLRVHVAAILVYGFAALLVANEVLRPLHKTSRTLWSGALSIVALSVPVLGAIVLSGQRDGSMLHSRHGCMWIGFAVAVPVVELFRVLDRDAFRSTRTRVLAIGTAGLSANVALALCCPSTSSLHLLLWHAPIGVLLLLSSASLYRIGVLR